MNYNLVPSSFGRASVFLRAVRQRQVRSLFQAPQVLEYKYMDQNSSTAMLNTKRSAGAEIEVEVNLRTLLHTVINHTSKAIHPGFETQGRHHQKSETGVLLAPHKELVKRPYISKEIDK